MTDTEKLILLVNYIRDAERYHLDNAKRGIEHNAHCLMAIQDICIFMENELEIEHIQLSSNDDTYVLKNSDNKYFSYGNFASKSNAQEFSLELAIKLQRFFTDDGMATIIEKGR